MIHFKWIIAIVVQTIQESVLPVRCITLSFSHFSISPFSDPFASRSRSAPTATCLEPRLQKFWMASRTFGPFGFRTFELIRAKCFTWMSNVSSLNFKVVNFMLKNKRPINFGICLYPEHLKDAAGQTLVAIVIASDLLGRGWQHSCLSKL